MPHKTEKPVAARRTRRATPARRIEDIENASQAAVSVCLKVSPRALREWDCPRKRSGKYSLPEVIAWRLKIVEEHAKGEKPEADPSALEELRQIKAKTARIEYEAACKNLLPVAEVRAGLQDTAGIMRRACGVLQKKHGAGAYEIISEALDEIEERFMQITEGAKQ